MKTAPLFSVIIPTLNEEKYLPKLLGSLALQTQKNFEVIVVDGSSKDKTVEVAKTFADKLPKLTVVVSKKAGLPLQRNVGGRQARGEWLMFIDADTVLLPYCIERADAYIQKTKTSFFSAWFRPDSENSKEAIYALIGVSMMEGSILSNRPFAPGPFSAVRKRVFDTVNGYNEKATFGEDLDFSLRVNDIGIQVSFLREVLFIWSLRRIRHLGGFKMLTQYMMGGINALIFNKALTNMPGYMMGGHLYGKNKKPIGKDTLRLYEQKFKRLVKEVFE
jgi:glycosyltransferase involved in cell wall biosynthesis